MDRPHPFDPTMERLQGVFQEQRQAHGQTYEQLAHASGLSRATLFNLNAGRYHGDLRTWSILARTWGMTLDELLAPIWD